MKASRNQSRPIREGAESLVVINADGILQSSAPRGTEQYARASPRTFTSVALAYRRRHGARDSAALAARANASLPLLVDPADKDTDKKGQQSSGVGSLLQIAVGLIFAFLYKSKVVDKIPRLEPREAGSRGKEFSQALCACWSSGHLCLHVWCCVACRAAHSWAVAGVMDYWPGVVFNFCCPCLGFCMRTELRKTLGLEPDGFMDCLKWCCCYPCAVGQDALQVDEDSGVVVRCCCQLQIGEEASEPLPPAGNNSEAAAAEEDGPDPEP